MKSVSGFMTAFTTGFPDWFWIQWLSVLTCAWGTPFLFSFPGPGEIDRKSKGLFQRPWWKRWSIERLSTLFLLLMKDVEEEKSRTLLAREWGLKEQQQKLQKANFEWQAY